MILEIRLKNFRQYRDQTLRFKEGLNLITGANNAGKSTIFYAIEYVLFGRVGGYKTMASLIHPKESAMGVELIFADQQGVVYRLQRVHIKPPKSRTSVVGHFTLKIRDDKEAPDAERYLLSTDFKDTEEALSMKLFKILGVTKRLFETAIHTRQGQCAAILAGAPQLDMVLGVTAAIAASEQLSSMALETEKKAAAKPILIQTVARLNDQLKTAQKDAVSFDKRISSNIADRTTLKAELTRSTEVLSRIETALNRFQATQNSREQIVEAQTQLRRLDDQISELTSELQQLSVEGGREVLAEALNTLEQQLNGAVDQIRDEDDKTARVDLAGVVKQQVNDVRTRDRDLWEFDASAAAREKLHGQLLQLQDARRKLQISAEQQQAELEKPQAESLGTDEIAIPDEYESLLDLKQTYLLDEARNRTKQEHLDEAYELMLEERSERAEDLQQLNREIAGHQQQLENMQQYELRAETFRRSSSAFKWLQTQLRESAAQHFGDKILDLHKKLSGGNELTQVRIDSKNYMVHVKSKGYKTESPAYLFQGGGQCVMLGLAFKLALAHWLGNVSFLLLDEPTDGLDTQHLKMMLEGLAECPSTKQILMITHVAWERDNLPVVHINRVNSVSEVRT